MTTLATDTFNRADGGLGANWTDIDAGWAIASNVASLTKGGGGIGSARYTGATFPNDQWAQVTIGTAYNVSDEGAGPAVRGQAGGDLILLQGNTVETRIYKRVGGTYTQLGTDGPAIASSDVLYLEVQGSTIVAKKNGTSICGSPISGSGLPASGNAGIWGALTGTLSVDDFSGGDFSGAADAYVSMPPLAPARR